MRIRETARVRVLAKVLEPERPRLLDQQPEDAATAGQLPDPAVRGVVDAGRDESLELLAALVEHADGRVARTGEIARDIEQPQDRLDVQRGDEESASCIDQPGSGGARQEQTRSCCRHKLRIGGADRQTRAGIRDS